MRLKVLRRKWGRDLQLEVFQFQLLFLEGSLVILDFEGVEAAGHLVKGAVDVVKLPGEMRLPLGKAVILVAAAQLQHRPADVQKRPQKPAVQG